jgi:Holliday junction resolvase RusA-like endonuclease
MIPEDIEFTLPWMPVPQPRVRISNAGGFARGYTPAKHPVVAYRKALIAKAIATVPRKVWRERFNDRKIVVCVWCCFARPSSHYGAKKRLKESAPIVPRPDVDNLLKAVMDALMGAATAMKHGKVDSILDDDVKVVRADPRKRYVSDRVGSHVYVRVSACRSPRVRRRMAKRVAVN